MAMGMSYDEFWDAPPRRAIAYREAYKLKRMADNELAWLNGIYVFDAVAVCVSNALSKPGAKKQTYIDKPLDIYPISEAEKKRREMSEDLLKRARFLVVCGDVISDEVKEDISIAKHSKVIPTTLAGVLQCG